MNLNASPTSSFPIEQINHDHNFDANFQVASSSSSTQDQMGYRQKDDDYAYHGGSLYNYEMKNKVNNGLKLTLWKKDAEKKKNNTVKWMSSKMRLMQKMKNNPKISTSVTNKYLENQSSSTLETDLSTNISSYNNNSPIRVCADCNTTKTPLWRSGPKGPKSLCNACGIRQRKARRAMAAAASGAVVTSDQPPTQTSLKIKVKNMHFKKMASKTSSNIGKKKNIDLEDFLINLSNKITFHSVFPEEEKDAAILLMALSSGLLHG